ncbi:MAG: hypothetical protein DRZ82_03940 [Thermoprotei archaeon]|nr:MAG: hypothetical protein DRZ82_03940 [Thermoprotei archaeon]
MGDAMKDNGEHIREAVAGGTWIFLGSLSNSIAGLIFWLVITWLAGVRSIGIASSIVSASSIAVTFITAGMNIAVVREVAARGREMIIASLLLAFIMGSIAAIIAAPLAKALGYSRLTVIASLLAILSVMSMTSQSSLIGLEMFKESFISTLVGSLSKLGVGVLLAVIGFKEIAPLIGYIVAPLTIMCTALMFIRLPMNVREERYMVDGIKKIALMAVSNYPYVFSNQLLTMLNVYIFAYLVREEIATGTLYMTLMIALAMASIPSSILSAALPIGTRRGTNPFSEGFRIGLALTTPIIAVAIPLADKLLRTINPDLVSGTLALRILMLSIAPLILMTTIIMRLNKEGAVREIALIGIMRLTLLIILLPILTKSMGVNGAAIAFLITNIALIPAALIYERTLLRCLIVLWGLHITTLIITYAMPFSKVFVALIGLLISIAVMHISGIYKIDEMCGTIRFIVYTLKM